MIILSLHFLQDIDDHIKNETVIVYNDDNAISPLSIPTRDYSQVVTEGCSRTELDNATEEMDEIHILGNAHAMILHDTMDE